MDATEALREALRPGAPKLVDMLNADELQWMVGLLEEGGSWIAI